MNNKIYYRLYGLILTGLVIVTIFLQSASVALKDSIIKEGGVIESLSAIGYFAGAILAILIKRKIPHPTHVIFILVLLGLRELDFHNRFTTMSLSKITFYVSSEVPLLEKMIGVAIVSLVLYVIVHLAKTHFHGFISAVKKREPSAIGVGVGILLIFLTKILDGLSRKLASVGVTLSNNMEQLTEIIEEVFELGIPMMFIIAIVARFRTV
ncbi:conserved hypothetical protein [Nitrosococcus halophilus Nc 4]|uniref:Uncharacterized protein n=1 Tax=Nitrosococcus halophilus (strain Nc4) TaxID=472759 RepID=D5BY23_NITHN|nr:hypothetical protein [Nitrosococcus halophilus]ADE15934.1 conserved hypothetical protein [Nitrosococcus halophilus Nc 4]